MDFINGCTTNVHVLDNFTATSFIHYEHIAPHGDISRKNAEVQRAVVELRRSKVLCTIVNQDIWLFGQVEHGLGEDFKVVSKGVVEGEKNVIRHLLEAIESALTHALAPVDDFTHVAPWTWLYCNRRRDGEADASVITLRVDDTVSGALYLLSDMTPTSWMPLEQACAHDSDGVLLAPHGRYANFAGADAKHVIAHTQWKAHVMDALQHEGIVLDEDMDWTDVEVVEDGIQSAFAWPSRLCLVHEAPQLAPQIVLSDSTKWQTWADNGQGRSYRNPLVEAEEWFTGFAERKLHAKEEATKAEARLEANVPLGPASDLNVTTSPPFSQRIADQQTAFSGIYPTPPDGFAQQGQLQHGPHTGLSAATPSIAPPGDTATTADSINDTQEQGRDSLDLDAYPMDEVEEDLFGDVGGGMFEENEVGDADFDYFDGPDDVPAVEATAEGSDMAMTDEPSQDGQVDADIQNLADDSTMGNTNLTREPGYGPELVCSPASAALSTDVADPQHAQRVPIAEKGALSPFGIRERLLPPPVPASVAHSSGDSTQLRRSGSFAPIIFRDGVDLGAKYATMGIIPDSSERMSASGPSIALPQSKMGHTSDDSSDESASSDGDDNSDAELPPQLPWETTKKRKRNWEMTDTASADLGGVRAEENAGVFENSSGSEQQQKLCKTLVDLILRPTSQSGVKDLTKKAPLSKQQSNEQTERDVPSLEELYGLEREDLIYVAQLIGEQASTCLAAQSYLDSPEAHKAFLVTRLTKALADILPSSPEPCDLFSLAMTRDPAPPPRIAPRTPVPPRTGPEVPDIFSLPAPFMRIQRNNDDWEMLPPALSFWEPNGLAAASGPKNVKARAVFPGNNDLRSTVRGFMGTLGRTYEGCKLGSHSYDIWNDGESDAGALVEEDGEAGSKVALLKGYAKACVRVGIELAVWCIGPGMDWEGTYVVYIFDPFTGGGWAGAKKYLCACFWMVFQSYITRLHAGKKNGFEGIAPDVVLQILPIELVAGIDRLVIPDPVLLANLAREVYDRCPAASVSEGEGDGAATPSILLAPPIPKRIAFQLLADVPAESLLQDGRVLHLAVAMSEDREWMSCVWSDGQGRILTQESFCLRGMTVGSVMRQAWQRTGELVGRLRVIWRVFLVLEEGVWLGAGLERVWRDVVTSGRFGGMTICVTLVKVRAEMGIRVNGDNALGDGAIGLATPASTPVAFSNGNGAATGTNSPNVGASDGFGAPLTPVGSENAISGAAAAMQVVENDPDAHLVDVEDESCGLLFKPQLSALSGLDGMANGAIVRKGREGGGERGLLGVSLSWTLQVKPQGAGAVEIGSLRQAEVTLREVLRMYRASSVLTRARGLHEGEGGVLPVHLAMACNAARALEGFFS